jgi:hypothetical protein
MLLARVIVAFGMIISSVILAAVIYRLTCPAPYAHVATPGRLLYGVWLASAIMAGCYLLGAASSVAVPGYIGSFLVLLLAAILVGAEHYFRVASAHSGDPIPFWSVMGVVVGLLCAGLLITRFGLTLSTAARLRRYALIALLFAVASAPLDFASAASGWIERSTKPVAVQSSISPNGDYLVWVEGQELTGHLRMFHSSFEYTYRLWVQRVSDGRLGRMTDEFIAPGGVDMIVWPSPNTLVFPEQKTIYKNGSTYIPRDELKLADLMGVHYGTLMHHLTIDKRGNLQQGSFWVERRAGRFVETTLSPDRRLLMVWSEKSTAAPMASSDVKARELRVWSLRTFRETTAPRKMVSDWPEWVSNTEIGYTDATGSRHIIRVVPPEARQ